MMDEKNLKNPNVIKCVEGDISIKSGTQAKGKDRKTYRNHVLQQVSDNKNGQNYKCVFSSQNIVHPTFKKRLSKCLSITLFEICKKHMA